MRNITKTQFLRILKTHPFESIPTIRHLERLLIEQRGYVIKMPKPGSEVVLLVSGGIDSITTWAMLMEDHHYIVHPVCVNTEQKRHKQELLSVAYFSKLFQKKYPKQYIAPFHINFPTNTPEISKALRGDLRKSIHPQLLKEKYDPKTNTIPLTRQYLFTGFFPFPAALAALFFDLNRHTHIRTIFNSVLPTDGTFTQGQTLTSMRSAMVSLCAFTNDYSWQVISRCFEKETGFFLTKANLIRWADDHNIPISKTYSCLRGLPLHCGTCPICVHRKDQFKKARVHDDTEYMAATLQTGFSKLIKKAKMKIKPILKRLHIKRKPYIYIKHYY